MLYGIDISHYQLYGDIKELFDNADFVIIKATEGKTFKDKLFSNHIGNAEKQNKLIGIYHYARPELNTVFEEVDNFLNSFLPYKGKVIPVLDWEGKAWDCNIDWCYEWLNLVEEKTGIKPMLYVSASRVKSLPNKIADNFPLWVASWGVNDGTTERAKSPENYNVTDWKVWQYTSKPIDKDIFNGTVEDWEDMAKPYCLSENTDYEYLYKELQAKFKILLKKMIRWVE